MVVPSAWRYTGCALLGNPDISDVAQDDDEAVMLLSLPWSRARGEGIYGRDEDAIVFGW
jgi:hypothetical protein